MLGCRSINLIGLDSLFFEVESITSCVISSTQYNNVNCCLPGYNVRVLFHKRVNAIIALERTSLLRC